VTIAPFPPGEIGAGQSRPGSFDLRSGILAHYMRLQFGHSE
jgi:hypothetical protein